MIDKTVETFQDAVSVIEDGAVILISGFGKSGNPTELAHGWCQSNANSSPIGRKAPGSRSNLTPLGQRGGTVLLKDFPGNEMSVEVEVIEDRSVGGCKFLQGLRYSPDNGQ